MVGSFVSNATCTKEGGVSLSANMYKRELTRYNTAGTEIAIYGLQSDENNNSVWILETVNLFGRIKKISATANFTNSL